MNQNQPSVWSRPATQAATAVLLWLAAIGFAAQPPSLPPLTTVPGSPLLPGKFVWTDLITDDVTTAAEFYAGLFGWTLKDYGTYLIAANRERPVCGMLQRPRPTNQPRARPRWIGYLSVANVKRAQRSVTKAGGQVVVAPRKFPKRGEQAVFADPDGALFGVVKSSAGDPGDFLADSGDWIWAQLLSRNAQRAAQFYREVGGYDVIEKTTGAGSSDYVLASEGYARATVRMISRDRAQIQPSWLFFIRVENVGKSVAQVRQLGGKVLVEPQPSLFDGKVAIIADPTGAAIGLLEWSEDLLKGAQ